MDSRLCWIITLTVVTNGVASSSIYGGLYRHVTTQSSDPYLPPIADASRPFMVGLQMGLQDITHVDRDNNRVGITLMMAVTWNSSLLWNPADFNGLSFIPVPRRMVWYPKIAMLNAASHYEDLAPPETMLFGNGMAGTLQQLHLEIFCDLSVHEDTCNVSAAISTHGNNLIHLEDPDEIVPNAEPLFVLSRHKSSAYPLRESRNVKVTFRQAGLPNEKDRIDLVFVFRDPHRHRRRGIFKWL